MIAQFEWFFKENDYQYEIEEKANYYPEERSLIIDYEKLDDKNTNLAENLLNYPTNAISSAEVAIKNLIPPDLSANLHFRVINLPIETTRIDIRNLRSEHLGKLISIEGLAKKATEVRPKLQIGIFKCLRCGTLIKQIQDDSMIFKPPLECSKEPGIYINKPGCSRTIASTELKLLPKQSKFIDTQKIEIQESPEGLRGGIQPQRIVAYVDDDLTGRIAPGDRVILNGILSQKQRGKYPFKSTIFDIYLNANSIRLEEHEFEEVVITEEEEEEIIKLSQDNRIYEKIIASIVPTIYGLEMEKEGLALQLFGGVQKKMPDGTYIRGDIHLILVGDPGTGKSQILRYIANLAPRGIYTSGKSTTASGLTASCIKDDFGEGRWTLEAGVLVLADKGMAMIDELDKMTTQDRSAMHEALEQQCVSIAKAGITATLQSRCAVLGALNPKYGRFDEFSPIPEQINMSPALLSRFDVIFSITDKPNRAKDGNLAEHILMVHRAGQISQSIQIDEDTSFTKQDADIALRNLIPPIEPALMRKYIAYAKRRISPVLTHKASQNLIKYYVNLRNKSYEEGESVPITPRQLEAFIRLAEASARIRLSTEVTVEDTDRAIKIVEYYLYKIARGEAGIFDIDRVATGTPQDVRVKIGIIRKIIKELSDGDNEIFESEIINKAKEKKIDEAKVKEVLEKMIMAGEYYEPSEGKIKKVR